MKNKIVLIVLVLFTNQSYTQSLIGLWEVDEVKVGNQIMTPVAKWTKINRDNTYESGNGWVQNSVGTWSYNEKTKEYLPLNKYGVLDEFGAFKVSFSNKKMNWEREEEGVKVIVSLKKITSIPMATGDKLMGLWDLTDAMQGVENILTTFDPSNKYYIFFRPDRLYTKRMPDGKRTTGYWHIDAHKPEITLISENKYESTENWRVEVTETDLILYGISGNDLNIRLVFERINQFPE